MRVFKNILQSCTPCMCLLVDFVRILFVCFRLFLELWWLIWAFNLWCCCFWFIIFTFFGLQHQMPGNSLNYTRIYMLLEDILTNYRTQTTILIQKYMSARSRRRFLEWVRSYSVIARTPKQLEHIDRLLHLTDANCIANMRMDRNTFGRLCYILKERGELRVSKSLGVEEQIVIFVGVLAYHKKNRKQGREAKGNQHVKIRCHIPKAMYQTPTRQNKFSTKLNQLHIRLLHTIAKQRH